MEYFRLMSIRCARVGVLRMDYVDVSEGKAEC